MLLAEGEQLPEVGQCVLQASTVQPLRVKQLFQVFVEQKHRVLKARPVHSSGVQRKLGAACRAVGDVVANDRTRAHGDHGVAEGHVQPFGSGGQQMSHVSQGGGHLRE